MTSIPASGPFPSAVERWQTLVRRRASQMDAAYEALGRTSADYWTRRAGSFHRATRDTANDDPLLPWLRPRLRSDMSVLDVGAGTGRFTLALAPLVRTVTAVEPSAGMRGFLQQELAYRGLGSRVSVVPTTWEEAPDDLRADVVLCAHVLYPVLDVEGFLRKLNAAARELCVLYLRAEHPEGALGPLWEHFHGEPRQPMPSYVAAVDVLAEMGIFASVEVVQLRMGWRWETLEAAEAQLFEQLILPDEPAVHAELRARLRDLLVEEGDRLTLPAGPIHAGIVHWSPVPIAAGARASAEARPPA